MTMMVEVSEASSLWSEYYGNGEGKNNHHRGMYCKKGSGHLTRAMSTLSASPTKKHSTGCDGDGCGRKEGRKEGRRRHSGIYCKEGRRQSIAFLRNYGYGEGRHR